MSPRTAAARVVWSPTLTRLQKDRQALGEARPERAREARLAKAPLVRPAARAQAWLEAREAVVSVRKNAT